MSARIMDDVRELHRLPQASEGQRGYRSMKMAFPSHATNRTRHCVGTDSSGDTLFGSGSAHPRLRQELWTSVFLPSLKLNDTRMHETRFCSTDLAHFRESKTSFDVAVSGNWNGNESTGSTVHAAEVSISVLSRDNNKESCVASATKAFEVPVVSTKLRSDTSRVIEPVRRVPRPARPSYSQEQKFFIMYHRAVKEESWEEIEELFREFFGLRTRDGLNSVYYRIRRDWGMKPVLGSCAEDLETDRLKVEEMAKMVSPDFLQNIGYRLGE
ncbi:hypothetical protein Q7P35_008901 [Cladosporium inversicolor]